MGCLDVALLTSYFEHFISCTRRVHQSGTGMPRTNSGGTFVGVALDDFGKSWTMNLGDASQSLRSYQDSIRS